MERMSYVLCVVAISVIHWRLCGQLSPTDLEPALLSSGLSHYDLCRFDAYRVNPPLVRLLAVFPVKAAGIKYNIDYERVDRVNRFEFQLGQRFVYQNKDAFIQLLFISRLSCVFFLLLMTFSSGLLGRVCFGPSKVLYCSILLLCISDPNLLGHSCLITNDVAAAGLGVSAHVMFVMWLRQQTIITSIYAGIGMAFAILSKSLWLILPVCWLFLCLFICGSYILNNSSKRCASLADVVRFLLQSGTIVVVSLYVICLVYLCEDMFVPLGEFSFVSHALTGLEGGIPGNKYNSGILKDIPVPFPKQFVLGVDLQKRDMEEFGASSYINGTWQIDHGWLYYYVYGICVKVPHVTQVVMFAGLGYFIYRLFCWFFRITTRFDYGRVSVSDLIVLITPALALFALVSLQDEFSIHFRYVFPCFPFFIILGGIALFDFFRSRRCRSIILAIVIVSSVNNLCHFPHFIPYFNELSGGSANGWKHMLGSSYDWGQDMLFIKDYLAKNNIPIDEVRIKDHGYRYWECIYPDIWERQKGPFKYDLVSANVLTRPEKDYLKRLEADEPTRICYTAWLFPIKEETASPAKNPPSSPSATTSPNKN
jgi:hypothetical protein